MFADEAYAAAPTQRQTPATDPPGTRNTSDIAIIAEPAPELYDHGERRKLQTCSNDRKAVMKKHRIYTMSVASVYPHYVTKAEKKGRTKEEVDEIIFWLTGHDADSFAKVLDDKTDFETFFAEAPAMNLSRRLIKGVVCGVRVEEVEEETMREIRYLDKLIDELSRGKSMEKILRSEPVAS